MNSDKTLLLLPSHHCGGFFAVIFKAFADGRLPTREKSGVAWLQEALAEGKGYHREVESAKTVPDTGVRESRP